VSRVRAKILQVIFAVVAQLVALTAIADPASAPVATGHPFAAPQTIGPPVAPGASGLGQVTLALLIVLAAVFAVAWVVRRMRGFGNPGRKRH
jgi:hypothetical protein